jgi:hypothetical protein
LPLLQFLFFSRPALDSRFRTLVHQLMTGKVRVNELEFSAMKEGSP